jgi:hypothetical protein
MFTLGRRHIAAVSRENGGVIETLMLKHHRLKYDTLYLNEDDGPLECARIRGAVDGLSEVQW